MTDTPAGLGNNGLDGKQVTHLPWLENPALRVNKRDALILENEPGAQLPVRKVTMHFAQHFDAFERSEAHQDVGVVGAHGGSLGLARCVGYQA